MACQAYPLKSKYLYSIRTESVSPRRKVKQKPLQQQPSGLHSVVFFNRSTGSPRSVQFFLYWESSADEWRRPRRRDNEWVHMAPEVRVVTTTPPDFYCPNLCFVQSLACPGPSPRPLRELWTKFYMAVNIDAFRMAEAGERATTCCSEGAGGGKRDGSIGGLKPSRGFTAWSDFLHWMQSVWVYGRGVNLFVVHKLVERRIPIK